ncbi:hypothetical protein ACIOWI_17945 [Streptomyces sp. NPDC087659]|uniref:hypothetical protein n=1 Tax=Streptomyces sp. NPDC087659 TaxID=3365801 RepID=UPI0038277D42
MSAARSARRAAQRPDAAAIDGTRRLARLATATRRIGHLATRRLATRRIGHLAVQDHP